MFTCSAAQQWMQCKGVAFYVIANIMQKMQHMDAAETAQREVLLHHGTSAA
jgi:hypothetical protein